MRNISIQTTQHVSIDYKLATLQWRLYAFIIDMLIIAYGAFMYYQTVLQISDGLYAMLPLLGWVWCYSLLFEVLLRGRTPGKLALSIRAARADGQETGFTEYFLRWVFRTVDIWGSFGAIGALMISGTARMQRLGDLLADTVVISTESGDHVALSSLFQLRTEQNYQVSYPQVKQLREEDIMFIRKALIREKRYGNRAHAALLEQLSRKTCDLLGMDPPPDKQQVRLFLRKVVEDYVVITR